MRIPWVFNGFIVSKLSQILCRLWLLGDSKLRILYPILCRDIPVAAVVVVGPDKSPASVLAVVAAAVVPITYQMKIIANFECDPTLENDKVHFIIESYIIQ